jgi:hypothetical protein
MSQKHIYIRELLKIPIGQLSMAIVMYICLHFSTCFSTFVRRRPPDGCYSRAHSPRSTRRFLFSFPRSHMETGLLGKRNSRAHFTNPRNFDSTYNWKPLVSPTEIAKFPKSSVVLCIPRHDFRKLYFCSFFSFSFYEKYYLFSEIK